MSEFKEIPTFPGYKINEQGAVQGEWMSAWWVTKPDSNGGVGGYHMIKLINQNGKVTSIGRHRLLALTFLKLPDNFESMVINHKNGIPGDDRIDNLEWVTRGQNNQHAYDNGLKKDASPVLVRNMLSGETTRYNTMAMCARDLGYASSTIIYWRLNKIKGIKRYPDELLFKYDDGSEWPNVEWLTLPISRIGVAQTIAALNVFTNELHVFEGLAEGQRITGIKAGTIQQHIYHNRPLPINGFVFRYVTKDMKWPKLNQRILDVCKAFPMKQPCGLVVTWVDKEYFFTSIPQAAKYLKLRPATIMQYAAEGRLYKGKLKFDIFDTVKIARSLQEETPE